MNSSPEQEMVFRLVEDAKDFREEQDERLLADYDVNFIPEQEMVFRRVEDARDFVSRIERFFSLKTKL